MAELQEECLASPVRNTVYFHQPYWYLFGNTRAFSAWTSCQAENFKVLFLGFGDIRNLLATTADCSRRSAAKFTSIRCDLNDNNAVNIARALLLLRLADDLDPHSSDDLLLYWGVAHCTALPSKYKGRLVSTIDALMSDSQYVNTRCATTSGASHVMEILRAWRSTVDRWPTVSHVQSARKRYVESKVALKHGKEPRDAPDLQEISASMSTAIAARMWPGLQKTHEKSITLIEKEISESLMSGSIYPDDSSYPLHDDWCANITLLQPGTLEWHVHYGACPFLGFAPLPTAAPTPDKVHQEGGRFLTKQCLEVLRDLLSGYKACLSAVQVTVRLYLGDAVRLCNHELSGEVYDVVDTSNLCDHVGPLNMLLAAKQVVKTEPHARLFLSSMVWHSSAATFHEYIMSAFGGDARLFPTLYGVRLLNDPRHGSPSPVSLQRKAMADCELRRMEFLVMRRNWDYVTLVADSGHCGISTALQRLCSTACLPPYGDVPQETCGLRCVSTLSLLSTIVGATSSGVNVIGYTASDDAPCDHVVEHLAVSTAEAYGMPACYRHHWTAMWRWVLHHLGHAVEPDGTPLLMYTATVQLLPLVETALEGGHTPLVQAVVFEGGEGGAVHVMLSQLMRCSLRGGDDRDQRVHLVDAVHLQPHTKQVSLLLPRKHSFPPASTWVVLKDMVNGLHMTAPMTLTNFTVRPFPHAPPPLLVQQLQHAISPAAKRPSTGAACDACDTSLQHDAAQPTQSRASTDGCGTIQAAAAGPVACQVYEYSDKYVLQAPLVKGTRVKTSCVSFPGCKFPGKDVSHTVKVRLGKSSSGHVFHLACPVDTLNYSAQASSCGSKLVITVFKTDMWPMDASLWQHQKLVVGGLPEWGGTVDDLAAHMGAMFSLDEQEARLRDNDGDKPVLLQIKETVQVLFVMFIQQGVCLHSVKDSSAPLDAEGVLTLKVHSLRRMSDGTPLLHLSVVDHLLAKRMKDKQPGMLAAAMQRFQSIVFAPDGGEFHMNTIPATPEEIRGLTNILRCNAVRMATPKWQHKLLCLPDSEWMATFVVPLYDDTTWNHPAAGDVSARIDKLMKQQHTHSSGQSKSSSSHRAGPGTHGPTSSSHSSALRCKEEGNKLFQQQRYNDAVQKYKAGLREITQRGGGAGPGRELEVTLQLNLGACLLKMAASQGAAVGATPLPSFMPILHEAERCCSAALAVEGNSAKGRYRRAQAWALLGRYPEAMQELQRMPNGTKDPAVQQLLHDVKEAMVS